MGSGAIHHLFHEGNAMRPWSELVIFGIGHSTRTIEEFVGVLWENGVLTLADVRRYPGSRRNPGFNPPQLAKSLALAGIRYEPLTELGGRRRPVPGSRNGAWRSEAFRGYADFLQTPAFVHGLEQLQRLAQDGPLAMMCAEAVPWRCHRSLIADALTARGCQVQQILGPGQVRPHRLTPFAHVEGDAVTYPAEGSPPDEHPR
jgi:uncharacterized protein (DUF488 family)